MNERVWVVMDADYDNSWVATVYTRESLADAHVAALGGWVTTHAVLDDLVSDCYVHPRPDFVAPSEPTAPRTP